MIDWKRVEELRDEIGADALAEVADMFLDEAEQAVRALQAELSPDRIEDQLHFLKGSALNLGLSDLAAICHDGERQAAAGQAAQIDTSRVAAVYQASRARLLERLATGSAA
jgi:HPt (histidine-containing phosphotransfer) domain-containing protein